MMLTSTNLFVGASRHTFTESGYQLWTLIHPRLTIRHENKRQLITRKISAEQMLVRTFTDLYKKFDNGFNPGFIQLIQLSADEHQSKLNALVSELNFLPPGLTFNCSYCRPGNPSTLVAEEFPVIESKSKDNNEISTSSISATPKNKEKIKKT
ncbi:hypothetical protein TNCV_2292431 [Trichonephila clavipes]|nr:hypothetical protein TNCV_2292431 [Trichonephila clavipes]